MQLSVTLKLKKLYQRLIICIVDIPCFTTLNFQKLVVVPPNWDICGDWRSGYIYVELNRYAVTTPI
jgi:hypothetical protein